MNSWPPHPSTLMLEQLCVESHGFKEGEGSTHAGHSLLEGLVVEPDLAILLLPRMGNDVIQVPME